MRIPSLVSPRCRPSAAARMGRNRQSSGAKAILHATYDFSKREYRNLYDSLNDRGKNITPAALARRRLATAGLRGVGATGGRSAAAGGLLLEVGLTSGTSSRPAHACNGRQASSVLPEFG